MNQLDQQIEMTAKNCDLVQAQLDLALAEKKLKDFREGKLDQAGGEESNTENSQTSAADGSGITPKSSTALKENRTNSQPSKGSDAQEANKVEGGILDLLHDQLTYRNTVCASMRERQLDDRHDLFGATLYDLQFDLTLRPGKNDEKFAQVTVDLLRPTHCNSEGRGGDVDDNKVDFDKRAKVAISGVERNSSTGSEYRNGKLSARERLHLADVIKFYLPQSDDSHAKEIVEQLKDIDVVRFLKEPFKGDKDFLDKAKAIRSAVGYEYREDYKDYFEVSRDLGQKISFSPKLKNKSAKEIDIKNIFIISQQLFFVEKENPQLKLKTLAYEKFKLISDENNKFRIKNGSGEANIGYDVFYERLMNGEEIQLI